MEALWLKILNVVLLQDAEPVVEPEYPRGTVRNLSFHYHIWRRSYATPPPPLTLDDPRYPGNEERYSTLAYEELPLTESLKDTIERVNPCWEERITPKLHLYNTVLVAAHGNSLRALAMMLLHLTPDEIMKVEIPTGAPWIFELDDRFSVLKEYYI